MSDEAQRAKVDEAAQACVRRGRYGASIAIDAQDWIDLRADLAAAQRERDEARAALAAAVEVLRVVEWRGKSSTLARCPVCDALRGGNEKANPHAPDCSLARSLATRAPRPSATPDKET